MNFEQASRFGWYIEPLAISIYAADFIFVAIFLLSAKKIFKTFQKNWLLFTSITIFFFAQSLRNSDPILGWYVFFRFLQFTVLLLLFSSYLKSKPILKILCASLVVIGVLQSALVIFQVTSSHSLGLKWLGEQVVDISMAGVAKVDLASGKIIRGYGTLPHPNILAGVLIMTLAANLWLVRGRLTNKQTKATLYLLATLQTAGVLLTFSRAGFLSLTILYLLFFILQPRKEISNPKRWGTITAVAILLFVSVNTSTNGAIIQRLLPPQTDAFLSERIFLFSENWQIFKHHFIFGVGNGQYILNYIMRVPAGTGVEKWQYDFPHNVIVQSCSEIGIFGFLIFALLVFTIIKYNTKNWRYFWFSIAIISPFLMFDHFLWTNQSGRILLVLFLVLLPEILERSSVEFRDEKSN